ncbi:MAG: hypothetical protein GY749_24345 [Desulfobacteraceae bacterium]|nr:hypothetical protein [Desulfobacteraceae bacterium]
MPLITIRETADFNANAAVSFDRQENCLLPLPTRSLKRMNNCWNGILKISNQVQAAKAADSVKAYGESLFEQLFKKNTDIYVMYKQAVQAGVNTLSFEITGPPNFHSLHWEAHRHILSGQMFRLPRVSTC